MVTFLMRQIQFDLEMEICERFVNQRIEISFKMNASTRNQTERKEIEKKRQSYKKMSFGNDYITSFAQHSFGVCTKNEEEEEEK